LCVCRLDWLLYRFASPLISLANERTLEAEDLWKIAKADEAKSQTDLLRAAQTANPQYSSHTSSRSSTSLPLASQIFHVAGGDGVQKIVLLAVYVHQSLEPALAVAGSVSGQNRRSGATDFLEWHHRLDSGPLRTNINSSLALFSLVLISYPFSVGRE
jgi:hypothetical protein